MNTIKLKIKHFGPVEDGFLEDDGYMNIPKVTLFCGPQGSGKSTIAKVLSSLMWLEKAAEFWGWKSEPIKIDDEFLFLDLLKWHGLASYFRSDMEISYRGSYLTLDYVNRSLILSARKSTSAPYIRPKIMYVPAERNFLNLLDSNSKLLPRPLRTLHDEFRVAQEQLKQRKRYHIPVNGYNYVYDEKEQDYYIENEHSKDSGVKTPLVEASSGLQSVLPLLLITDNLLRVVQNPPAKIDVTSLVVTENPFIYRSHNPDGSDALFYTGTGKEVAMESWLRSLVNKSSHFVNIVEEPEQNLFPPTQRAVIRHLLMVNNAILKNRLIISTHSPYVVADLVASVKADYLFNKVSGIRSEKEKGKILELLDKCYPLNSLVCSDKVCLYETSYDGTISRSRSNSIIPDNNFLNKHLVLGKMLLEELDNIDDMIDCSMRFNGVV